MAKPIITQEIQQKVGEIVDAFNKKVYKDSKDIFYIPKFKGGFLYLDRKEYENLSPVIRLKYTGDMNKWEFAIFKWSTETFDPDEWMFPGARHVDGTIQGAMKAGVEAYPV